METCCHVTLFPTINLSLGCGRPSHSPTRYSKQWILFHGNISFLWAQKQQSNTKVRNIISKLCLVTCTTIQKKTINKWYKKENVYKNDKQLTIQLLYLLCFLPACVNNGKLMGTWAGMNVPILLFYFLLWRAQLM